MDDRGRGAAGDDDRVGPPARDDLDEAAFSFTANAADATFECSLDGAPFAACEPPAEYSDLEPGEHAFEVRALDGQGGVERRPARRDLEGRRRAGDLVQRRPGRS